MTGILLDTNILIDMIRGYEPTAQRVEQLERTNALFISAVTWMEVISGCKNKQSLKAAEIFLERFRSFSIDPESSGIAVRLLRRYNLSHGLLTADALVAAISIRNALPLLTRNQKDFRFIEELSLV